MRQARGGVLVVGGGFAGGYVARLLGERGATIVSPDRVAEIAVTLPLTTELEPALTALEDEMSRYSGAEVFVSGLAGESTLAVRVPAGTDTDAERLERELRLRAHERLRAGGLLG